MFPPPVGGGGGGGGTAGMCDAREEVGTFSKGMGKATVGFVVSNGNCGEIGLV